MAQATRTITVSPRKLRDKLLKTIPARLPVLIKGAPGIGKSDIVVQAAEETDCELILTHPVVSDPTDFKGLPIGFQEKGKMVARFLPFGDLEMMIAAKVPTIVFIDDLGQAPAVVQAACMQLILARRVNGHRISDKVVFIAATNRREDRAGVTGIIEPVKSRFAAIYELEPTVDDWTNWAAANKMPHQLIAWVNFRKMDVLMGWKATADIVNGSCPRTIANAGRLMNVGLSDLDDLAGAMGEGAANDLNGFLKVYEQLPDLARIPKDPDNTPIPTETSALYAVASALIAMADKENFAPIIKYSNRMPIMYCALFVRGAIRKNPKLQHTSAFTNWLRLHQDVLV